MSRRKFVNKKEIEDTHWVFKKMTLLEEDESFFKNPQKSEGEKFSGEGPKQFFEDEESMSYALDSTAYSLYPGKEDQSIGLEDSRFVLPLRKPNSPRSMKVGKFIIESYMRKDHRSADQREFQRLVAKYFQMMGCELFAPRRFRNPKTRKSGKEEKELNEPGFELWSLPADWIEPVRKFKEESFFETDKRIRYVVSFPKKQGPRQKSVKNQKFLSASRLIRKMIGIWNSLKKQFPIHMILFMKEPKSLEKKQNVEDCFKDFINSIKESLELRAICKGFTILTTDYSSLEKFVDEKETEGILKEKESSILREKEALNRNASLTSEIEEKDEVIRNLLLALGASSIEEVLTNQKSFGSIASKL